jgi:hypothetical protein
VTVQTELRKINFGCGYDQRKGYLNVDVDPACEPDVLIVNDDYTVLPADSFDEIMANDVLEHIPRSRTAGVLLDWSEYLVVGGSLHIQTSSILGVAQQMAAAPTYADQAGWTICLFGNQAHPGDFHFTGFTETTLRVHLLAGGYDVGEFRTDDGWLLSVDATKRMSWSAIVDETSGATDAEFTQAIYRFAFDRDADETGLAYFGAELGSRRLSRGRAVHHLLASPERLFLTAAAHGL